MLVSKARVKAGEWVLIHGIGGGVSLVALQLCASFGARAIVTSHGDELLVRVRDAQRRIALPASVAGRPVDTVRLAEGVLEITFAP